MKKLIIFLLLLPGFTTSAQSKISSEKENKIDSLVAAYMSRNNIPGASVAIVKDNKRVFARGYGMADMENFVPATPATIFRLASVSKPITAVAVMQLVEQGKIDLNAPVQKYLPQFPKKKYPVTVKQLLSHTSGIRHYQGNEFLLNKAFASYDDALTIFQEDSLMHKPEVQQTYSTYGYTVLGAIVESVTGMSFIDYLKQNIFEPANMDQTFEDDPRKIIAQRSENYDTIAGGIVVNSLPVNTSYKVPGGGLISNAYDMSNFLVALQQDKLLKKETWKHMTTETKTSGGEPTHYGLGWILGIPPFPGFPNLPNAVWHGGVQQGSTTAILMLPEEKAGVVLLSNSGGFGNDITLITALIADAIKDPK